MLYGTDYWAIDDKGKEYGCSGDKDVEFDVLAHKIRNERLRWFRYVKRKEAGAPVRVEKTVIVDGKRSRGRPKLIWNEWIRHDLLEMHL